MSSNKLDYATAINAATAPAWAAVLSQVNLVLTFVSLALGIAFLLWRWRRSMQEERIVAAWDRGRDRDE